MKLTRAAVRRRRGGRGTRVSVRESAGGCGRSTRRCGRGSKGPQAPARPAAAVASSTQRTRRGPRLAGRQLVQRPTRSTRRGWSAMLSGPFAREFRVLVQRRHRADRGDRGGRANWPTMYRSFKTRRRPAWRTPAPLPAAIRSPADRLRGRRRSRVTADFVRRPSRAARKRRRAGRHHSRPTNGSGPRSA
jgi:hypothetical protein